MDFIKKLLPVFLFAITFNTFAEESFLVKRMQITVEGVEGHNFNSLYNNYVNKQVVLENVENELLEYFSNQDYLFPQISISEDKLKYGFLNVYVKMTSINEVIVRSNNDEKNPLVFEYIKEITAEKPIKIKNFQKYIALLNRIPGYQVSYEFRPSGEEGDVDLILSINKSKGELYVSSDSYGTSDYGEMQNVASLQLFSPFNANDAWTIYGITTNHPDRYYTLGMNYSVLINNYGTSANFLASTSRENSSHDNYVRTKDGVNNIFAFYLNHPLYLDNNQILEGELGGSYKTSKSYTADVNLSGNPLALRTRIRNLLVFYSRKDTENKYSTANAGLKYYSSDKAGGNNAVLLSYVQGVNGTFKDYSNPTAKTDESFNYTSLEMFRDQELPKNFSMFTHIMGAYTQVDAPDQELPFLGGRDFGRGYDSGILVGNKMLAASLELRYNKEMPDDNLFVLIQPYIFRDMGYIGKQDKDTNISHLSSYGAGVRFILAHNAEINIEVAEPVKKLYKIDGIVYEAKTNIGIIGTKSFKF